MRRQIHNPQLKKYARDLRTNATKEERKLWYTFLKTLPVTFYRQKTFGDYIVDFYCAEKYLVIELDGSQHYEEKGQSYDERRDSYLRSLGLKVLRFSNYQISREYQSVCNKILLELDLLQ